MEPTTSEGEAPAGAQEERLRLLLIDDEPGLLKSLGEFLRARGHQVQLANNGRQGLELLERREIDAVITDVRMPEMDGLALLAEARRRFPEVEVVLMTGQGDIEMAVQAMKDGAFDFFAKPTKLRELAATLQRISRFRAVHREKEHYRERLDQLRAETRQRDGVAALIGESPAMQKVKELIGRVCGTDQTTVLIRGETGTGKEVVARAIHDGSARARGPFTAVDCTAISEALAESQLFGHVKGAFTDAREARKGFFEQAHKGVLFLDEIGDLPPAMQAKLLRALEQRRIRRVGAEEEIPVDVRVLSATNRDLSQGNFRQDLYYRLNTLTIHLPPLRQRGEDIGLLAQHFLDKYARELHRPVAAFSSEALARLRAYPFPGNVRELRNTVERAVLLCPGRRIEPADLQLESAFQARSEAAQAPAASPESSAVPQPGADLNLEALEQGAIQEALRRTGNNQVRAAELLGISRTALRRRLQK